MTGRVKTTKPKTKNNKRCKTRKKTSPCEKSKSTATAARSKCVSRRRRPVRSCRTRTFDELDISVEAIDVEDPLVRSMKLAQKVLPFDAMQRPGGPVGGFDETLSAEVRDEEKQIQTGTRVRFNVQEVEDAAVEETVLAAEVKAAEQRQEAESRVRAKAMEADARDAKRKVWLKDVAAAAAAVKAELKEVKAAMEAAEEMAAIDAAETMVSLDARPSEVLAEATDNAEGIDAAEAMVKADAGALAETIINYTPVSEEYSLLNVANFVEENKAAMDAVEYARLEDEALKLEWSHRQAVETIINVKKALVETGKAVATGGKVLADTVIQYTARLEKAKANVVELVKQNKSPETVARAIYAKMEEVIALDGVTAQGRWLRKYLQEIRYQQQAVNTVYARLRKGIRVAPEEYDSTIGQALAKAEEGQKKALPHPKSHRNHNLKTYVSKSRKFLEKGVVDFDSLRDSMASLSRVMKGLADGSRGSGKTTMGSVKWAVTHGCEVSENNCGITDMEDIQFPGAVDMSKLVGKRRSVPFMVNVQASSHKTGYIIGNALKIMGAAISKAADIRLPVHLFIPMVDTETFVWLSVLPQKLDREQQRVVDATLNILLQLDSANDDVTLHNVMLGGYASVTSHAYSDEHFEHEDLRADVDKATLSLRRLQVIYEMGLKSGHFTDKTVEEKMGMINEYLSEGDVDVLGEKSAWSETRFKAFLTLLLTVPWRLGVPMVPSKSKSEGFHAGEPPVTSPVEAEVSPYTEVVSVIGDGAQIITGSDGLIKGFSPASNRIPPDINLLRFGERYVSSRIAKEDPDWFMIDRETGEKIVLANDGKHYVESTGELHHGTGLYDFESGSIRPDRITGEDILMVRGKLYVLSTGELYKGTGKITPDVRDWERQSGFKDPVTGEYISRREGLLYVDSTGELYNGTGKTRWEDGSFNTDRVTGEEIVRQGGLYYVVSTGELYDGTGEWVPSYEAPPPAPRKSMPRTEKGQDGEELFRYEGLLYDVNTRELYRGTGKHANEN